MGGKGTASEPTCRKSISSRRLLKKTVIETDWLMFPAKLFQPFATSPSTIALAVELVLGTHSRLLLRPNIQLVPCLAWSIEINWA